MYNKEVTCIITVTKTFILVIKLRQMEFRDDMTLAVGLVLSISSLEFLRTIYPSHAKAVRAIAVRLSIFIPSILAMPKLCVVLQSYLDCLSPYHLS